MASAKSIVAAQILKEKPTDITANEGTTKVKVPPIVLTEAEFNERVWMAIPISAKIGFPLKIAGVGPSAATEIGMASYLLVESNPSSEHFGKALAGTQRGVLIIARCDGCDLQLPHIDAAVRFLMNFSSDASKLVNSTDKENYAAKERLAATLTPEVFKDYFEKLRQQSAAECAAFADTELPDIPVDKYCHFCGTLEKEGEAKLLCCGGCKEVYYCSKGCQKLGWK